MPSPKLIALSFLIVAGLVAIKLQPPTTTLNLDKYATTVVRACAGSTNHQECYEKELPKLVSQLTLNDQFKVVTLVQSLDTSYVYCHVLGHSLGASSVKKNPSHWESTVADCSSGSCSNGCIHGALQEKFDADALSGVQVQSLVPDLIRVCQDRSEWQPTENERTGCYHALGHTTMYLTKAAVTESINLCQKISHNQTTGHSYFQNCLEGLFMQIFQPLDPEDLALVVSVTPNKVGLTTFCDKYQDLAREACYREGWVLYAAEIKTPAGLSAYCEKIPTSRAMESCYSKMFFSLMNTFNFDATKMESLCLGLGQAWQEKCFADAAARYITAERNFADRAVSMCQRADNHQVGKLCFDRLVYYSTAVYRAGSNELKGFCQKLPEGWKETCLNKS